MLAVNYDGTAFTALSAAAPRVLWVNARLLHVAARARRLRWQFQRTKLEPVRGPSFCCPFRGWTADRRCRSDRL